MGGQDASESQYGPATPTPTVTVGPPQHGHSGPLPLTGYQVAPVLLAGVALVAAGTLLRGWLRKRPTT